MPCKADKRRNNLGKLLNMFRNRLFSVSCSAFRPHWHFKNPILFRFEAEYLRNGDGSWKVSKLTSWKG